jgi:polysaccharide deacetylase 2 family uncharacterized protein YibQ
MKLPRLTLPVSALQVASRAAGIVRGLPRRVVISAAVTLGVLMLFLGVSLLPTAAPEAEVHSTVVRLKLEGGVKPEAGLLDPGSTPKGAMMDPAGAVIAANGAIISDPALIEMTADGPLPRIATDGRTPMATYARKTDSMEIRPRIAIVVTGLGLSQSTSVAAIDKLPPGTTLGFSAYGRDLQGLVSAARGKGNEVVMELPLEPFDFPNNDPGQNTLLAGASSKSNGLRLRWVMSRFTGYAGLVNAEGSKFLSGSKDMGLLLDALGKRGLYFVDSGVSDQSVARDAAKGAGASFARADVRVDANLSPEMVAQALAALEKVAMQKGRAIGISGSYPGTLTQIATWANELEKKGFALVPLSALVSAAKARPAPAAPKPAAPRPEAKPPALRTSRADSPVTPQKEPGPQGAGEPHAGPHP